MPQRIHWRSVCTVLSVAVFLMSCTNHAGVEQVKSPNAEAEKKSAGSDSRPNIVFILTDDLSWNLVPYMPHVQRMQKDGITFSNYFVTDSLCCPSRSSIFTGRYPHDTGIFRNIGEDGGYLAFHNRGLENETFANALSAVGYRTAILGKYLNGYQPKQHVRAPGWTSWTVAGDAYKEFNYQLREGENVVGYGTSPKDYLTDVISGLAVNFIRQSEGQPFLLEVATFAPHTPYVPAPRDLNALPGLRAPRTSAFDAEPDIEAPHWLHGIQALSTGDIEEIDRDFRKRAQSVLAVDAMIGEIEAAVTAIGQQNNTYFVFSSDNGLHMGEHRLMPGKMTAYDIDIHVPLIVTGPKVPGGITADEVVENVDLCPTFIEMAGAPALPVVDGHSFNELLKGKPAKQWRKATLIEHHGPLLDPDDPDNPHARSGNPPSYEALRSRTELYVEYNDGEREYHALTSDPDELHNTFSSLSPADKARLGVALSAMRDCHDSETCWNAGSYLHPRHAAVRRAHAHRRGV